VPTGHTLPSGALAEDMLEVVDRMNEAYANKMKSDAAIIAEALMMSKTDGVAPVVVQCELVCA